MQPSASSHSLGVRSASDVMDITAFPTNKETSSATNDFIWTFSGSLATNQNNLIPKLLRSRGGSVDQLKVLLQEAPTGQAATFTFKKNAVSIGVVSIAAGDVAGTTDLGPVAFDAGDIFTVEITQIGNINFGTTATMIARVK